MLSPLPMDRISVSPGAKCILGGSGLIMLKNGLDLSEEVIRELIVPAIRVVTQEGRDFMWLI